MIIHIPGDGHYRAAPIEVLAELVHPDAAVFWDRDMGEFLLDERSGYYGNRPLRFQRMGKTWCALNGLPGWIIARWNNEETRWVPDLDRLAAIRREFERRRQQEEEAT